jgi:hypothetical protein
MNYDWCFQEGIDDSEQAWLIKALEPSVTPRFNDTRLELRARLNKYGENRTEASLYDARARVNNSLEIEYLCLMECERDKPEPIQSAVFVGSGAYTRAKCDEIQARVIDHTKNQPAAKRSLLSERSSRARKPCSWAANQTR